MRLTTKVMMVIWYILVFIVVITLTILGLVLLTPDRPETLGYDCQLAQYPQAIDLPQAYIKACREAPRR